MTDPVVLHSASPQVRWFPNVITADEAQYIIDLAKPNMERASVMAYGGSDFSDGRTSSVCWLQKHGDKVIEVVCKRIAEIVDQPLTHAEKIQVVHYLPGQEFRPHVDAIRPVSMHAQQSLKTLGGQRVLTALVYLNQVDGGGETYFPKLEISQAPTAFSMLVFTNMKEGSNLPDPLSLHGAAPVTAGEKWAFNLWFRQSPTGY